MCVKEIISFADEKTFLMQISQKKKEPAPFKTTKSSKLSRKKICLNGSNRLLFSMGSQSDGLWLFSCA